MFNGRSQSHLPFPLSYKWMPVSKNSDNFELFRESHVPTAHMHSPGSRATKDLLCEEICIVQPTSNMLIMYADTSQVKRPPLFTGGLVSRASEGSIWSSGIKVLVMRHMVSRLRPPQGAVFLFPRPALGDQKEFNRLAVSGLSESNRALPWRLCLCFGFQVPVEVDILCALGMRQECGMVQYSADSSAREQASTAVLPC